MPFPFRLQKLVICALTASLIFGLLAQLSTAKPFSAVNLEWDPNPETDIAGYVVHYGTTSGEYSQRMEVGASPEATLFALELGTTYYCVVQAFNTSGLHGHNSTEISFSPPDNNLPDVSPVAVSGGESDEFAGSSALIHFGEAKPGSPGITKTFSVTNPSPELLGGLAITAAGATFTISSNGASSLAPGETTDFSVTFRPLTAGSHAGVIRIHGNEAGDKFYEIHVQGSGVTAARSSAIAVTHADGTNLAGDSATEDLGAVNLGATSGAKFFTIHNTGTANLTDLEIFTDGSDVADFIVGPLEATFLAPGESTIFGIAFQPAAAGFRSTSLRIASSDPEQKPVAITLSGTGTSIPILSVENANGTLVEADGAITSFGAVNVSSTGRPVTYIVRNIGTARLTGLQITTSGTRAAAFVVGGPPATSLEPGASTRFTVAFRPTSVGPQAATLQVTSTSTRQVVQRIDLHGIGIAVPEITVMLDDETLTSGRKSVDFGNCLVGSTSSARIFTIKNSGSAPLSGLSLVGEVSDFLRSSLAATILAPGASTTFKVNFRPASADPHSAQLAISSNDTDERSFMIDLTGEGLDAPEIVVRLAEGRALRDEAAFVNMGTVELGSTSKGQVLTIFNSGTANLENLSLAKGGLNDDDFTVSALRTTRLAPGGSTSVKIDFSPSRTGTRWAALRITSNDGNERVFDIVLTGTGERDAAAVPLSMQAMSAPGRIGIPLVQRIEVIGGRKYLTLTHTRTSTTPVSPRDVEVSSNLVDWASGKRHTTVLIDNATTLKVRDNIPLTSDAKRYIRLKPNR